MSLTIPWRRRPDTGREAREFLLRAASEPIELPGRWARVGSVIAWYVVPAIAVLAVSAYVVSATLLHVNPPVMPVEGVSMRPTLQAGDLVFLKAFDRRTAHKGEIIAVSVPKSVQSKYHLPGRIVHRIVSIGRDNGGPYYITKGDGNATPDGFETRPGYVIGELAYSVPGAGYPFLFFRSRQGEWFLGACALVAVLYFLVGVFEERRAYAEGTAVAMQTILDETQQLKSAISQAEQAAEIYRDTPRWGAGTNDDLERLTDEVAGAVRSSRETGDTMRELVGAISEYGEHLRSHTEVMRNLAATTAELQRATRALARTANGEDGDALATRPSFLPPPVAEGRARSAHRPLLDFPAGLRDDPTLRLSPRVRRLVDGDA